MCVLSGCKCEITFKAKMIERGFFCRIFCIMKLFIKRGKNTFHLEITFTFFNQTKVFSLLRLVSLWSGFFSWFWNLINVSKKISSFIKLPEIYKVYLIVHLIVHLSCASWNKFQFFDSNKKVFSLLKLSLCEVVLSMALKSDQCQQKLVSRQRVVY